MKILWGIVFATIFASSAQADLFSQLQGTYQVLSCENLGATPYNSVCQFSQVTLQSSPYITAITFLGDSSGGQSTLTLTLPANLRDQPTARYCEKGDAFAIFSSEGRHSGQVVMLRKLRNGLHHLSIHLRSDVTKTLDVIEVDLEKIH